MFCSVVLDHIWEKQHGPLPPVLLKYEQINVKFHGPVFTTSYFLFWGLRVLICDRLTEVLRSFSHDLQASAGTDHDYPLHTVSNSSFTHLPHNSKLYGQNIVRTLINVSINKSVDKLVRKQERRLKHWTENSISNLVKNGKILRLQSQTFNFGKNMEFLDQMKNADGIYRLRHSLHILLQRKLPVLRNEHKLEELVSHRGT
jgi:hypothetical protein